jgi:hypothetical protein
MGHTVGVRTRWLQRVLSVRTTTWIAVALIAIAAILFVWLGLPAIKDFLHLVEPHGDDNPDAAAVATLTRAV